MDWNKEKSRQLGMTFNKASHRLKKMLLFDMAKKLRMDKCFRCGQRIESPSELHLDHKTPWLHEDNAVSLFFDLNNIAFSHPTCNMKAARRTEFGNRLRKERKQYTTSISGFKGVSKKKDNRPNPWQSSTMLNGKRIHFGCFSTAYEAATAYDKGMKELFGNDIVTNRSLGLL